MITNADIARLLTSGLKTTFMQGMKEYKPFFKEVCTEVPSTKAIEEYAWLGENPMLREWKDERAPKALLENGFTLKNKHYEASLAVDRDTLEDDQYGQVKVRAQALGRNVFKSYDKLFSTFLEAGTSELCYDGQYFFDTDHVDGASGNQSNAPSAAAGYKFGEAGLKTVYDAMLGFKDDKGVPMGIMPTHVMIPSGLYWTAKELLDPSAVMATTDPGLKALSGALKIIVNPFLTNAGTVANSAWYMLALGEGVKPFIYQNRKNPEFTPMDKSDDYANFMRKEIMYGVDSRFAFGYGDWRMAFRAEGA